MLVSFKMDLVLLAQVQARQVQHVHQLLEWRRRRRRERQRAEPRTVWLRQWIGRREEQGLYHKLLVELRQEDQQSFKNFLRMPAEMFDELLERLEPRITKKTTNWRMPIEPGLKLALTLRHLATGATYQDMEYAWRVPNNTISKIVVEVCKAIVEEYTDELLTCPATEEGWRKISDDWYKRWNFPQTIGAIDGKHIEIKKPANSGSDCFNYKNFFSIVLFAMVSSDYRFLWVDVNGNGSMSDATIFNASELKEALEADDIAGWPRPEPLPNDNTEDAQRIPFFIVGDDAFSLRTWMMKPYGAKALSRQDRIFNYRLSRARRVVENSFGILAQRFQVLLRQMHQSVRNCRIIVKTCVLLHNLMRTRYPVMNNRMVDKKHGDIQAGAWRRGMNLADCEEANIQAPNRDSKKAKAQRNYIRHWVNSEAGSVSWQDHMVDTATD